MKSNNGFRKYVPSMLLFLLFEAVAVTLWLTKDNLFYLLNFSYIGACLGLGTALFTAGKRYARHFVQLAVGSYMLLYLGIISRENMQIEGFWYYLFLGVFEAATIHYAVAKIFGPLLFGRGWCGYAPPLLQTAEAAGATRDILKIRCYFSSFSFSSFFVSFFFPCSAPNTEPPHRPKAAPVWSRHKRDHEKNIRPAVLFRLRTHR